MSRLLTLLPSNRSKLAAMRYVFFCWSLLFFACENNAPAEETGPQCPTEFVTYNSLEEALANPGDVGELLIPDGNLTAWPAEMARMECLRSLDVTGNQLGNLPDYATTWRQLGKLKIDGNGLTALPAAAGNWTYFNVGFFNDNQLSSLPESVADWGQCIQLKLNGNRFTEFPAPLFGLEKLNRLSLNDNRLTALPTEGWKGMKNLEYLELKNNQLTDLPTALVNAPNIRAIYVQGNPIPPAAQKQIERKFMGVARVVF